MKKIFLTVTVILVAGILTGCTSTPTRNSSMKKTQTKEYSSEKEIFDEIYSFLDKPVITEEDIDYIWHLPFGFRLTEYDGRTNFDGSGVRIDPHHFTPIETTRTDYTGRIINKTDKKVTFLIGNGNCGSYNQDKWYFFDVEPGETGYFVLPNAISKELKFGNRYTYPFINIYTLPSGNIKGEWNMIYSIGDGKFHYACIERGPDLDNDRYYLPLLNEVMKEHSFEMIYTSDEKFGTNEVKFIEAFEYSWKD